MPLIQEALLQLQVHQQGLRNLTVPRMLIRLLFWFQLLLLSQLCLCLVAWTLVELFTVTALCLFLLRVYDTVSTSVHKPVMDQRVVTYSLVSHTLRRKKKGLVTLQLPSCHTKECNYKTGWLGIIRCWHPLYTLWCNCTPWQRMRSTKSTDLIGHIKFLPWGQLNGCNVTRPFLSLRRVDYSHFQLTSRSIISLSSWLAKISPDHLIVPFWNTGTINHLICSGSRDKMVTTPP